MARSQLNFRIGEGQKEAWQEHVDSQRYYDTVSDLIKRAVENQIERDNGGGRQTTDSGASSERLNQLLTAMNRLEGEIEDLDSDVGEALDAVYAQEGLDHDVISAVFDALPTGVDNAMPADALVEEVDLPGRDVDAAMVRLALRTLETRTKTVAYVSGPYDGFGEMELTKWFVTEGA